MRIGEFEFTDNGSNVHVKYVGKPIYLTTASPNNHPWIKELLNKWYGRHEFVYKAPPLEFEPVLSRKKIEELVQNSYLPDAVLPLSDVRTIIFKKEKETAMKKDIRDYIGCYVKDISFDPPYTTIVWEDGTSTSVFCKDEPYDSEKGFAMAVLKKLFGDEYYECMKEELTDHGAYEKDAKKVRYRIKKLTAENEKLKKENEELSHSRLVYENRTLTALNKDLADRNYELEQKIEKLKKTTNQLYGCNNKMLDDANAVLKSANNSLRKINDVLKKENEDLKKAKENMAKKLAETKQLKKDLDAQMLNNGELDRENQKLRRDAEIKSDIIGMQREDIHRLKEWFRREAEKVKRSHMRIHELEAENEKYKDIVDMQKRYDELKEQYDLLTECHKRQAFTIGKQREEVEKLNKIKEILK